MSTGGSGARSRRASSGGSISSMGARSVVTAWTVPAGRATGKWRGPDGRAYIPRVRTPHHPASTVTRPVRVALLALAAAAGAGCEGTQVGTVMSETTFTLGKDAEQATTWTPTPEEPITIEMAAPTTTQPGVDVPIRVTVHNGSKRGLSIGFGQRRGLDLIIAHAEGPADSSAVWSLPKYFLASREVTVTDPLAPGRDTVFSVVWPGVDDSGQKVPPGAYRIRATVPAELVSTRRLWTPWVPITVRE